MPTNSNHWHISLFSYKKQVAFNKPIEPQKTTQFQRKNKKFQEDMRYFNPNFQNIRSGIPNKMVIEKKQDEKRNNKNRFRIFDFQNGRQGEKN